MSYVSVGSLALLYTETWQSVIEDNFSHGEDPIRVSVTLTGD